MSSNEEALITEQDEDPCLKCLLKSEDIIQCPDCEHTISFLQVEAI